MHTERVRRCQNEKGVASAQNTDELMSDDDMIGHAPRRALGRPSFMCIFICQPLLCFF